MAIYTFYCDRCHSGDELMMSPKEYRKPGCPTCGDEMRRVYQAPKVHMGFQGGYHDGLGQYVGTRREFNRLCAERGLETK